MSNNFENGKYWQVGVELVSGCSPCSPGCKNCWSAALAHRFYREGEPGHESGIFTDEAGRFNGDIVVHPERLCIPLKRRKLTVYSIWNDWAHEAVDHDFRRQIMRVAEDCRQHTVLALTKRPEVALDFTRWMGDLGSFPENWWNGLTICTQQEADKKLPIFLQIPGNKFLNFEPLLENIILPFNDEFPDLDGCYEDMRHNIKAVILGCETGRKARQMNPDWAINIVRQCKADDIPIWVKQVTVNGKVSKNMSDWPEELRARGLPWVIK